MTIKPVDKNTANIYLKNVNMHLDNWERIKYLFSPEDRYAITYKAPKDSRSLYCFSLQVATWLPRSSWKLFQIDASTTLAWDEEVILGRLLLGKFDSPDFSSARSFIFEFGNKQDCNNKYELIIADVIYLFLLFECHCYITSSSSIYGQILAVQDGFIGFISRDTDISGAHEIIKEYENSPASLPKWMLEGT